MEILEEKQIENKIGSPTRSSGFLDFIISIGILILGAQLVRYVSIKFEWHLFLNEKFAFSINIPIALIYVLYFVVMSFMFYYFLKHRDNFNFVSKLGFIFILAGGFSNLIERIVYGHVVDYIFLFNGILNLADFYIFFGLILILFFSRKNSVKL